MTFEEGLVSVIMPVYNGEQYLHEALGSLLAQHYGRWELILIDDGSTDGTRDVVTSINDPRIRYHYQENRGQTAALNQGLALVRGAYVTTLDADDAYTPESLGVRVAYLEAHARDGVVYGDGLYCDENGQPFLRFSELMPTGVAGDVFGDIVVSPFFGTGASIMIRREVIEQASLRYDESIVWCQDWDFYIRLAALARFGYVDSITVRYRVHGAGMTAAMQKERRLDSLNRLRMKVMASPRFEAVAISQRSQFFYDVLIVDLDGRPDAQERMLSSSQFRRLPAAEQGRLLRLVAADYVMRGERLALANRWLRQSWRRAPLDAKSAMLALFSAVHPGLARLFIKMRRAQSPGHTNRKSPFETRLASEQSLPKRDA